MAERKNQQAAFQDALNLLNQTPGHGDQLRRQPEGDKGQGTVDKRFPEGMAQFFDDSWLPLLQQLQGGAGPASLFPALLQNFKGDEDDLQRWQRIAAPFMAASLFRSPAYQKLSNFEGLDRTMQSFGAGAGQIGAGAQQGIQQGQNQLARAGLGRSGAMAGMAQQGVQQAGAQQGNLWTQLFQQAQQNRINNAATAFDMDNNITRLALGMQPAPRMKQDDGGLWGQIAGSLGSGIGGLIGSLIPGGTGVGASIGDMMGKTIGGWSPS